MRHALLLLLTLQVSLAWGEAVVLAQGYGELAYEPPAAGTYALPSLGTAVDGRLLDVNGKALNLYDLLDDRLVLMGFIYTHCPDVNGCPLASYVMKKVQARLVQQPELRDQVRLVSLSFDPQQDTPGAMRDYARHFQREDFDWRFVTTKSETDLQPILDGYGQWRQKLYREDGSYSGSMSHILRVYLIDRDKRIRNIYSAGFLHPDTVVNDIQTVLMTAPAPVDDKQE